MILLAIIGVPRVIAHDLGWVEPGSFVNLLLVFVPPLIWIVVVLRSRTPRPFTALLTIGLLYGVMLGLMHQLLWSQAFDTPPTLGGNLSNLPPAAHAVITRGFAFLSSLSTGAVVGAITGIAGIVVHRLVK
ncbi:hypothetical protein [Paenibacillus sp. 1P07SE]|uniref:hypothetical protein n=1 Tax=Paenibacillus sp. 1P07SE TaxID=3132209 RepID=UPI0039A69B7D